MFLFPKRKKEERNISRLFGHLYPKQRETGGGRIFECITLRGESFCLPQTGRDAPLGQRQGGVFRLPPPYLWTPPTPQRVKGCTPLTNLKKKSKHKKASAAPVGAIALTLFSLLHLKPLSRCATAPRGGAGTPAAPRFRRKRRCKCSCPLRPLP